MYWKKLKKVNPAKVIPGGYEVYWSLKYLRGNERPWNGRWNRLQTWLDGLGHATHSTLKSSQRVLCFSFHSHWVNQMLPLAVTLVGYDCNVDLAFLPYENFEPNEPKLVKRYINWSNRFIPSIDHPRMRVLNLANINPGESTEEIELGAKRQSILDVKHIMKREEIDLDGNSNDKKLYEFRLSRNLDCMMRLASLMDQQKYDVMILQWGEIAEFGSAKRVAQMKSLPCTTFENFERKGTIALSHGTPCFPIDLSVLWKLDAPHTLSNERKLRVQKYIGDRESGNYEDYFLPLQISNRSSTNELLKRLNLKTNSPVVLMCTNLAWDGALLECNSAFPSMLEWVRSTVRYFALNPAHQLIVRTHPAEILLESNQPVARVIEEELGKIPDNIHVIYPEEKTNTYDLMPLCDLALVYVSTTGLEISARGIPVIVAGKPHYSRKGFTIDPDNVVAYYDSIEGTLSDLSQAKLTERQVELAWCYMDLYFNFWPKPYPWGNYTYEEDVKAWPISRVLSDEGKAKFGDTFAYMLGRINDEQFFRKQLA